MVVKNTSFFQSHEFFPHLVNIGEELISLEKRPELGGPGIIDINSNNSHIGMFIGIEKNTNGKLVFGPNVINKPHVFRNILNYTFVKLLEYYSLQNVNVISVKEPSDPEFKTFLEKLNFEINNGFMKIDISGDNLDKFVENLEKSTYRIRSQSDQIDAIVKANNPNLSKDNLNKLLSNVTQKVQEGSTLDETFWNNRQASQVNLMLNAAKLYESELIKEEFLEMMIKTVVSSFELGSREAKMENFLEALEDTTIFTSAAHIQKIVEKMQDLLKDEIKNMDKNEYKKWIDGNMDMWKLVEKNHEKAKIANDKASKLKLKDFGPPNAVLETIIQDMIDHYNGDCVFYGIKNKL